MKYIFNLVLQKMEQQLELLRMVIGVFTDSSLMRQLEAENRPDRIAALLCGQGNEG